MNQKDFKEIAGIIKNTQYEDELGLDYNSSKIIHNLADYFEKEENKRVEYARKNLPLPTKKSKFNKKQFLKDCGVE